MRKKILIEYKVSAKYLFNLFYDLNYLLEVLMFVAKINDDCILVDFFLKLNLGNTFESVFYKRMSNTGNNIK